MLKEYVFNNDFLNDSLHFNIGLRVKLYTFDLFSLKLFHVNLLFCLQIILIIHQQELNKSERRRSAT